MGNVSVAGALMGLTAPRTRDTQSQSVIVKPPRLQMGDTIGLVNPASPTFEPSTIREGVAAMEHLGFRVKLGKNVGKKLGYLAGTDEERAEDLLALFADDEVKAIVALRGGYGTCRMVPYLDFQFIRNHPKILLGYSDISYLHLALLKLAGMVSFHGPVAISSFTEYTKRLLFDTVAKRGAVGELDNPPDTLPINLGRADGVVTGQLVGGNLTMIVATLGTPYEIETEERILFIEEVGEEPYDIDRMLTQLKHAGKLQQANGIVIDRCSRCGPAEFKPAFSNTMSIEEVFKDRLGDLDMPVLFGLSIGHTANKPTLPLGITARLDVTCNILSLLEPAVI